jgi:hypothetical protein
MGTREELLSLLPEDSIGVEIGVFKGDFSDIILNIVKPKKLFLIDPWIGNIKSGDKNGENIVYINGDEFYNNIILPKYRNNEIVTLLRDTSKKLSTFDDNFFDWCYIDGDHSYDGVKYDLELLRNKTKNNGIIMCHDYISPRFVGVVRAVDEFCMKYGLKIERITNDGCPSILIYNKK